jgi:hypothetical protein
VADTGIRLEGPSGRLQLLPTGVTLESGLGLTLRGTTSASLQASGPVTVQGGGPVTVNGPQLFLNGNGCGVLRRTDLATFIGPGGGVVQLNPNGSPAVRTGC